MDLQTDITRDLLEIGAVQIKTDDYFTWTSGIKSPIYCDNRLTMSFPIIRKKIVKAFLQLMKEENWEPHCIVGCATAGIPHAAWLAQELDVPMGYVRSKPKGHGKGNQIEGHIEKGQQVIVIEDLISTGGSALDSANVLIEQGVEVLGVLAIFTYGLDIAQENFEREKIAYRTITSYDRLLDLLLEEKKITMTEKEQLEHWRNQR